jgi:nitrate/nitrite transporter NarK
MQDDLVVRSLILTAASASCPDCPPVRDARALVLGDAFWTNALWIVLPFVAIALVLAWFARQIAKIDQGARHD